MSQYYVSEYGNWGGEEVIVFDTNDLTTKQWNIFLNWLGDYERINYVKGILAGEDVSEFEQYYTEEEVA